jgi:DNA topoisomerase I
MTVSPSLVEEDDATAIAEEAGLIYVSDAMPGIRRRRRGRGFSYLNPDEGPISAPVRRRIQDLVIPPAWSDVWICPAAKGHLQATGRDARGRKQYRYHDRWREVRDADKFSRLAAFGAHLPDLRRTLDDQLTGTGLTHDRVLALVVKLLDETLIRVGNEEYAVANESYGLTTLKPEHIELHTRSFTLEFVGKGGAEHDVTVDDPQLARLVSRCHELGGHDLFSYRDEDQDVRSITSTDVNDWLHTEVGPETSAKTFRTWGASSVVVRQLAAEEAPESDQEANEQIVAAVDVAAASLRNTRAVCRQSYVHPAVLDGFRDGTLRDAWDHSRSSELMRRSDQALLKVLDR